MLKKSLLLIFILAQLLSLTIYAQTDPTRKRLGIKCNTSGSMFFFTLSNHLRVDYYSGPWINLTPNFQLGRNEFYAGINYPLRSTSTWSNISGYSLNPRLGFTSGYNFNILKPDNRINFYLHYEFHYLRYYGHTRGGSMGVTWPTTETQESTNNVFGYGLVVYFDKKQSVGLCFTQGYLISSIKDNISRYTVSGSGNLEKETDYKCCNISIGLTVKLNEF